MNQAMAEQTVTWEKRHDYIPQAITSLAPFRAVKSAGAIVTGDNGKDYIDLTGGWGCLVVGHSHPKVVDAIKNQADQFVHTDYSVIGYQVYLDLAKKLCDHAPGPSPKRACFFNSGAEAVENAVKIARYHTGRPGVVVFDRSFHGRTLLTMTMTHKATPYKAGFGPFTTDVYRVPFPSDYHTPITFEEWERELTSKANVKDLACIVVEPMQGEGGFIPPREGFMQKLREFTKAHGIVMVCDEVQTGMARSGTMFASEQFGIEPDLITVAKSLASGMPLSGVIGVADVIDSVPDSGIGGTYVGNPIACAAGNAVVDIIEEEGLLEKAKVYGAHLKKRFEAMKEKYPIVGDVRGVGALQALELVTDRDSKTPASQQTANVIQHCLDNGVITAKAGLQGNVLRMLIPLVITESQLDQALDVLEAGVAAQTI